MIEERREEVRRLLEDAEKFCELAEKESDLRQAAEKAWLCVRKATEAYFYATDPKADLRKLEEGIGLTGMFWERYKKIRNSQGSGSETSWGSGDGTSSRRTCSTGTASTRGSAARSSRNPSGRVQGSTCSRLGKS
jgi:hypothetical protein